MTVFRATPESPRMFESDFIDFFSRTPPAVVPVLFVPAIVACIWRSGAVGMNSGETLGLLLAGFFCWTFSEYWLHRRVFHWQPGGKWGERFHFWAHGVHHQWPKDKLRLVMPPAVSLTLFFLVLGVTLIILGPRLGWAFHAGFTLGYMVYDLTHYYLHHFTPRTQYGRQLKKHHMLHHFKDDGARFGVSWMFWDRVFGTKG